MFVFPVIVTVGLVIAGVADAVEIQPFAFVAVTRYGPGFPALIVVDSEAPVPIVVPSEFVQA